MLIMVDLSLLNWLNDGEYRIKVLLSLKGAPNIPKNISKVLNIHKSSLSRILKDLYEKGLLEKITSSSRTITYKLSDEGEKALKSIKKKNEK